MATLHGFLKDELAHRDWTVPEFAERAGLSVSNAYLIVRDGKDNVRLETFVSIAAALSMSPAELMMAIGLGAETYDVGDLEALLLFRRVPTDRQAAAKDMLRGLTRQS